MALINSPREAEKFSQSPIKHTDLSITADVFLFNCWWNDFTEFIRGIVASNQNSHAINWAHETWYNAYTKCKAYEKAIDISLHSLHVSGSPWSLLYDTL